MLESLIDVITTVGCNIIVLHSYLSIVCNMWYSYSDIAASYSSIQTFFWYTAALRDQNQKPKMGTFSTVWTMIAKFWNGQQCNFGNSFFFFFFTCRYCIYGPAKMMKNVKLCMLNRSYHYTVIPSSCVNSILSSKL